MVQKTIGPLEFAFPKCCKASFQRKQRKYLTKSTAFSARVKRCQSEQPRPHLTLRSDHFLPLKFKSVQPHSVILHLF